MVSLEIIESSNDRIRSTLQAGLVAVFVGGTNGVGETTVRQFAKYAAQPRVYIVGRSQEAGDRVTAECGALNPEGTFAFLKRETSLMRNVDEICNELASKEEVINLLFLTVGTLQAGISESADANRPRLFR
jgi:NAD(P)-dependent dehydrogenase (short-subunit alcohol dehydrogenase family)